MPTRIFQITPARENEPAIDALQRVTALSKTRLKDAMLKGAVWLRQRGKERRLRRNTTPLLKSDSLVFYYDPDILALAAPEPRLVADEKQYSVWYKPPGLLAQGTREGDHCALPRLAQQALNRECYLVHRLDREASGLMLLAHTVNAAARLSAMFADHTGAGMRKLYRIEVRGALPETGEFSSELDGKAATTRFTRETHDAVSNTSTASVELVTGRKHQIRRHFSAAGFPVMGDPRYGTDNADARGLQLKAVELAFTCPLSQQKKEYRLPD